MAFLPPRGTNDGEVHDVWCWLRARRGTLTWVPILNDVEEEDSEGLASMIWRAAKRNAELELSLWGMSDSSHRPGPGEIVRHALGFEPADVPCPWSLRLHSIIKGVGEHSRA